MLNVTLCQEYVRYTLEDIPSDQTAAELPLWTVHSGDDGYFAVPYREVCFLTYFTARGDTQFVTPSILMPMAGIKSGDKAYLAVFEGMKWDARIRVRVQQGMYTLSLVYDLDEITLYEKPSVRIYTLTGDDANYSGMARLYRRLQVEKWNLQTLKERMVQEPLLRYAMDNMPVIRIRMGWKPVPSPVLEQTPDTEPDMFAACTFRDVEKLADEMKRHGIDKAELVLVGWNVRGHDGRWPQAFPVEEKLGGEEGLRHLIRHAKQLGYRVVCHTNVNDAYRIADCWDEQNLIRTKGGKLRFDSAGWGGGRMYDMCLEPSVPIHERVLDKLRDMGTEGFHYVDVLSIVAPRSCFHPDHPLNADEYVQKAQTILQSARKHMGGVASEGGMDFAAGLLDFALYISFNLFEGRPDVADEPIPLWQLVYHGYILNNASSETVNCMVKAPRHRLKAIEYGSIPAVYYYSRFVGGERKNWMGDADMRFATEAELKDSVMRLKAYLDANAPFADRQMHTMERHDKLANGVYSTTYSDGKRVLVNYNDMPYKEKGLHVPPQSVVLDETSAT